MGPDGQDLVRIVAVSDCTYMAVPHNKKRNANQKKKSYHGLGYHGLATTGSYHGSGFHTLGSPYLWYEFHPDRRVTAQDVPSSAEAVPWLNVNDF